ncbi:uncharacterized protein C5orf34 homolog isoform X2 [Montipora foliosa]|uniref:uncharacterized protein C5orf34 homolog isoform X2 n=1 Tax=Montipora foliosa TaxID=591990 RepID=UPI0035F20EB8
MKQLTRFALSSYRGKVMEALKIRNCYASRPYLCRELSDNQEIKVFYQSVSYSHWPTHSTPDFITKLPNGAAQVQSLDGLASLTLLPHKQSFIVRFLTEVKHSLFQKTRERQQGEQHQKTYLVWQEQIHSTCSHPEVWTHPLQLLLDVVNLKDVDTSHSPQCKKSFVTKLPESLPLTCHASHHHTWRSAQVLSECGNEQIFLRPNMKLVWKKNTIFRFFYEETGLSSCEIIPGDGSLVRSQGINGRYFNHWFVQRNEEQAVEVLERVYSADKPPPERFLRKAYSVGRLLKQAVSYIEYLNNARQYLQERCCWEEGPESLVTLPKQFSPAKVVETVDVPGTGRFRALSNGNINVVFCDRTILDLRVVSNNKENKEDTICCSCQLILSNGVIQCFKLRDMEQCADYQKYLQAALHWQEWVKATPSQRKTFYKDTIWDPNKRGAIKTELEKIKRFKYINSQQCKVVDVPLKAIKDTTAKFENLKDDKAPLQLCGVPDREATINSILEQNNKAIDDIDGLITLLKCSNENTS